MSKKSIADIDKNFKTGNENVEDGIKYYSVLSEPFSVHGVFYANGKFRRMDESVAKSVSEGVYHLHTHCSGGRIRFCTDSSVVAIKVKYGSFGHMPHFSIWGSAGFDIYADGEYAKTFKVEYDGEPRCASIVELGELKMRRITINMPSYAEVEWVEIGLKEGCLLQKHPDYKNEKPVVFYGSSITQGGCSSRPGTIYQNFISRRFDMDYINLGFSGNARGEQEITDYLCSMDMSMLVIDYDHNAPDLEHLKKTHEKLYLQVRKAHPDIPVIMCSRPKYKLTNDEIKRREVVYTTYKNALARGERVYFIDGPQLMALAKNEGTVDDCHPNDLGFYSMAQAIIEVMEQFW